MQDGVEVAVSEAYHHQEVASQFFPRVWRVVVKRGGRRMTLPYWKSDTNDEPSSEEVMGTLLSQARSIREAPTFEQWAGKQNGYGPGDVRTEHAYYAALSNVRHLRHVLCDLYDVYLRTTAAV